MKKSILQKTKDTIKNVAQYTARSTPGRIALATAVHLWAPLKVRFWNAIGFPKTAQSIKETVDVFWREATYPDPNDNHEPPTQPEDPPRRQRQPRPARVVRKHNKDGSPANGSPANEPLILDYNV